MEQLTIDGITYNVLKSETADDIEAERPNTAREMRKGGTLRILVLQRPKGKKYHVAYQYPKHPWRAEYRVVSI